MTRASLPQSLIGLGVAFAVGTVPLAAQQPVTATLQAAPSPAFTADSAAALALRFHPQLRAANGRRLVAHGQARQDAAFTNPTIEWRRENLGSPLQKDEFLTVYLPLDLTGRRFSLRAAVTQVNTRATLDSAALARDLGAAAAAAWWRAALAAALHDGAVAQAEALGEIARYDAVRLAEGAVSEQTAIRARLEADRARLAAAALAADRQRALAELARATGVPPHELPVPPSLLPSGPVPTTDLPATAEEAVALALRERVELAAREAAVRAAIDRGRAEGRGLLGDLTLQGGSKQTAGLNTGQIGAALPLPLLHRNGGARERTRGEREQAEAEREEVRLRIAAEATAAWDAYRSLAATASQQAGDGLAERADDLAGIAAAAYREGGTTLLELLDAQRARLDARGAALRWHADLHLALIELRRALGTAPRSAPESR